MKNALKRAKYIFKFSVKEPKGLEGMSIAGENKEMLDYALPYTDYDMQRFAKNHGIKIKNNSITFKDNSTLEFI